ncbi:hypothetical protein SEVIR_4G165800v4 [Setaria viridis]|uniref:Uncharacterized protein n=1 Tax=Setaria viridis TaxID=4556 RepID=A0A4U6V233_SETVI|nr:uncharacterized protein LOC117853781 isoform X2 [Setaria viridis]TKW21333.1 hypothetical protein SEVIR_4G165800v2 [Setaria viridis]
MYITYLAQNRYASIISRQIESASYIFLTSRDQCNDLCRYYAPFEDYFIRKYNESYDELQRALSKQVTPHFLSYNRVVFRVEDQYLASQDEPRSTIQRLYGYTESRRTRTHACATLSQTFSMHASATAMDGAFSSLTASCHPFTTLQA